jgi:hypothetical protein
MSRIQQNEQGDPRPNPQNVQGKPGPNPQQAPMGEIISPNVSAEIGKLGAEKAGRVRTFLNRKRDQS